MEKITTCSIDLIQDRQGKFYVCEFNLGVHSAGILNTWSRVRKNYEKRYPEAIIDDYDRVNFEDFYSGPMERVASRRRLCEARTGLVIFRLFLTAKEEFALRQRYKEYNPLIVDPLAVRVAYDDKAYAAALDDYGIFPHTVILTKEEIQSGRLLDHFDRDEWIIIKYPRSARSIGTCLAYAGDKQIPLTEPNHSPFLVVQPVIETKGYWHEHDGVKKHYNIDHRVYLTLKIKDSGWDVVLYHETGLAKFASSSGRPEAVLLNRHVEGKGDWENVDVPKEPLKDFDPEALELFLYDKVIPYIYDLMSNPLHKTVKEKLRRAQKHRDPLRMRVLDGLLADKNYFSLDEPASPLSVMPNFLLRKAIAWREEAKKYGRIAKQLTRQALPIRPNPIRQVKEAFEGVMDNRGDYYIRHRLGLE